MAKTKPALSLVVLPISPWSECARWALDHHRLAHKTVVHTPFLGELRLRRLVGEGRPATVPLLIADGRVVNESWGIARYADREGEGAPLIPEAREREVREWNDLADATKRAGRPLVVASMLASPESLDEGHPPEVPRALRPLLRPLARYGTKWFAKKYGLNLDDAHATLDVLRSTFHKVRDALAKGSPYLLGDFSYADIAVATCLQAVVPVDGRYMPIGPATRKAWTHDAFAKEFADLVAWRDNLYERHRTPAAQTSYPGLPVR